MLQRSVNFLARFGSCGILYILTSPRTNLTFPTRGEVWGVRCAVRLCIYTQILLLALLLPLSHLRCHIVITRITVVMSRSAIIAVFSAQRVKIAIDMVTMFVLYVSFFICLFLYSSSPLESHQIEQKEIFSHFSLNVLRMIPPPPPCSSSGSLQKCEHSKA